MYSRITRNYLQNIIPQRPFRLMEEAIKRMNPFQKSKILYTKLNEKIELDSQNDVTVELISQNDRRPEVIKKNVIVELNQNIHRTGKIEILKTFCTTRYFILFCFGFFISIFFISQATPKYKNIQTENLSKFENLLNQKQKLNPQNPIIFKNIFSAPNFQEEFMNKCGRTKITLSDYQTSMIAEKVLDILPTNYKNSHFGPFMEGIYVPKPHTWNDFSSYVNSNPHFIDIYKSIDWFGNFFYNSYIPFKTILNILLQPFYPADVNIDDFDSACFRELQFVSEMKNNLTKFFGKTDRHAFFWGLKNTYGVPTHQDQHGNDVAMFKGKKEFHFLGPKFKEHACPIKFDAYTVFGVDFHLKYGYCTSDIVKRHAFRVELEAGDLLI